MNSNLKAESKGINPFLLYGPDATDDYQSSAERRCLDSREIPRAQLFRPWAQTVEKPLRDMCYSRSVGVNQQRDIHLCIIEPCRG